MTKLHFFSQRRGSTCCLQCVISIWLGFKHNPRHTWSTNHFSHIISPLRNKVQVGRGDTLCPVRARITDWLTSSSSSSMPRCVSRCSTGHHMVTLRTHHAGKRTYREGIWMNGTVIYSRFSSRLPQTVVCFVYPAGWRCLTISADTDSALDRSITRIGRSKCRGNEKVLTTRALRNLCLQDAATKVGVTKAGRKVKLVPECRYVIQCLCE